MCYIEIIGLKAMVDGNTAGAIGPGEGHAWPCRVATQGKNWLFWQIWRRIGSLGHRLVLLGERLERYGRKQPSLVVETSD